MSADNYVVVRKFGENDFRWGMFFDSDDNPDMSDKNFRRGPFKTPREAASDANEQCCIIEYGIQFEDGCLCGDMERSIENTTTAGSVKGFKIWPGQYEPR